MDARLEKLKFKIKDGMLLGSIYDNIMKKTKYRESIMNFLYNVMMAQKHRMLYYHMLKKKYYARCIANREWESKEKHFNKDTVWFMWMQGYEKAPDIVKVCYKSLKKNLPDKEIVFLDMNNIWDYIEMPEYIIKKWEKGIIGNAHFSDMIRLELLINKGGFWIDSTVLCTDGSMLKLIEDNELFMFSFYYFGFNPEIMRLNNWFMYSTTNNNILCLQRKLLYEYWKENDRTCNYFLFQILMTIATDYYFRDYRKMPIVSQVDAHVLATYIADKFDHNKYDILKHTTGIHKLSTRFAKERLVEGTFYDVVINKEQY